MRIANICFSLPVPTKKRGGVDRLAHELANGLVRAGHQVTMWTYDPRPPDALYQVQQLPGRKFYRTWLGQRLIPGGLGNFISLHPDYRGFDAIIAHGDSLFLPSKGLPVIRIMHGSALGEALAAKNPWRFGVQMAVYVEELLTAWSDSWCVGVSQNSRRYNPFLRRVIPNGVDLSMFHPDPPAKTREPSLLFVGVLGGRKRGKQLLDWFSRQIRTRFPTATLAMVTPPGPSIDGVTYHSAISTPELAMLYRRAWIYASPSTYEGFGLPYVEAMASGTAVVATPNPGSIEVCDHGKFGRLVQDRDFAGAVNQLLAERDQREELVLRGLERARQFSLDSMVRAYERLLTKACTAAPSIG